MRSSSHPPISAAGKNAEEPPRRRQEDKCEDTGKETDMDTNSVSKRRVTRVCGVGL